MILFILVYNQLFCFNRLKLNNQANIRTTCGQSPKHHPVAFLREIISILYYLYTINKRLIFLGRTFYKLRKCVAEVLEIMW